MRRLHLTLALLLSLAAPGLAVGANRAAGARPARAKAPGKGRRKPTRRRKAVKNNLPKRLGEGFFSRAYRSRDGKWVIKKLKPRIADVKKVSKKTRAEMAKRSVVALDELRAAGLPVPKSYIPEGKEGVIVQAYAEGLTFKELQGKAKFEASKNLMKLFAAGRRVAKAKAGDEWYVDENRENVFFHPDGRVKVWFDPVVPTKGSVVRSAQRLLQKQKQAAAK